MAVTADFNEQNYINTSLTAITSNYEDAPQTGQIFGAPEKYTPMYATRTATNVTTGQSEYDTALIIN